MIISYRENGEADSYALVDQEGRWLMTLLHNGSQVTQAQRDNLRRMVACWNAFDGMTTEGIEALPATVEQIRRAIGDIARERNRLEESMRTVIALMDGSLPRDYPGALMVASRAIARLEGKPC